MTTIIGFSFWNHALIIGSSAIKLYSIAPLEFHKECIVLTASILYWYAIFFIAFLAAYLPWNLPLLCITDSVLTQPSLQVFKNPSCSFSYEATSFFRCKGSMLRPFRLWATGTTPYWPMILWKSSFFFFGTTKRVFAENALAHPSICITLIAPVKFDV